MGGFIFGLIIGLVAGYHGKDKIRKFVTRGKERFEEKRDEYRN